MERDRRSVFTRRLDRDSVPPSGERDRDRLTAMEETTPVSVRFILSSSALIILSRSSRYSLLSMRVETPGSSNRSGESIPSPAG
jgi:hypothetical protein